jgi:ribosomal protein S18 acetylase RimI-like enzyme
MDLAFRKVVPADFRDMIEVIESAYSIYDPDGQKPGRHPVDMGGPPWSWWGDNALSWYCGDMNGVPVAFIMWRIVRRNAHIHSFFVRASCQNSGIGSEMLKFHWLRAIQEHPGIQTFTLHVRIELPWAIRFYEKNGYMFQDQGVLDPEEDSGRGDWVMNCRKKGVWPLSQGQLLMLTWRKNLNISTTKSSGYYNVS